ncbi:MAG: hypothetical protein ACYC5R_05600 [Melioribacteraceae bacterium]
MELIEIISDILVFGGVLLVLVVLISFFLSKAKLESGNTSSNKALTNGTATQLRMNNEQKDFRKNQSVVNPQIFQLNNYASRELKIVRKRTVDTRDVQERMMPDNEHLIPTNGTRTRYTIVNDELNKSSKAANFYF